MQLSLALLLMLLLVQLLPLQLLMLSNWLTGFLTTDIVADAGLRRRDVTVIADKGFESEFNEAMLDDASLNYVLAVRRGCAAIPEIPSSPDKYGKAFKFRRRAIYCNEYPVENGTLFLYYDMALANDEAVDFITRKEKANNTVIKMREAEDRRRKRNKGRLSQEEYERLVPVNVAMALQAHGDNGTFILKTNRKDLVCYIPVVHVCNFPFPRMGIEARRRKRKKLQKRMTCAMVKGLDSAASR